MRIPLFGLIIWLCFLCGYCFPDTWWATNSLAFIDPAFAWSILLLSALGIGSSLITKQPANSSLFDKIPKNTWMLQIGLSLGMGFLFYNFPMVFDHYGDSHLINERLHDTVSHIPDGAKQGLFSFSLAPWAGQDTILALATYIAFFLNTTYQKAFFILDALCGIAFIFLWLSFVPNFIQNKGWRIVLSLTGITAPFLLIFFGHLEIYAPVLVAHLAFLLSWLSYT